MVVFRRIVSLFPFGTRGCIWEDLTSREIHPTIGTEWHQQTNPENSVVIKAANWFVQLTGSKTGDVWSVERLRLLTGLYCSDGFRRPISYIGLANSVQIAEKSPVISDFQAHFVLPVPNRTVMTV